jgi:nitrogen-specific signal transduction histidine kinase
LLIVCSKRFYSDTLSGCPLFPFFTTKSIKGTGLGLWISKGIIQKYEGRIRFRSLRLNGRNTTCFSVYLPDARSSQIAENAKVREAIGSL